MTKPVKILDANTIIEFYGDIGDGVPDIVAGDAKMAELAEKYDIVVTSTILGEVGGQQVPVAKRIPFTWFENNADVVDTSAYDALETSGKGERSIQSVMDSGYTDPEVATSYYNSSYDYSNSNVEAVTRDKTAFNGTNLEDKVISNNQLTVDHLQQRGFTDAEVTVDGKLRIGEKIFDSAKDFVGKGVEIGGKVLTPIGIIVALDAASNQAQAGDYEGAVDTLASFGLGELAGGVIGTGAAVLAANFLANVPYPLVKAAGVILSGLLAAYSAGELAEDAYEEIIQDLRDLGVIPEDLFDGLLEGQIPSDSLPVQPQSGPFGIPLPPWFPNIGNPFDDAEDAPPPRTSPIVLDLGVTGIDLAAVNTVGSVYWDIDNDNFSEASDWVGPEDGLLCIDLNDDGTINNHSELFGTATTNGYTILDAYDTNNDNYITSADTQFGDLLVWVDANSDGISQSGELHTLSSLGITSIRTTYSNVNYTIDGVQVKQQSDFTMNGVTRTSVDAWFAVDAANSEYRGSYNLDVRTLFLPTLRGFGDLKDLHVAMSSDENLLEMVQDIATADLAEVFDPTFDLRGRVEDILIEWAGAEGISPTARGPHFDAQHLKVLEKLMGRLFDSVGSEIDPHTYSGFLLQEAWENLVSSTIGQILGQTAGVALFSDTGTYNAVLGQFDGEYVVNISAIENLLDTVEPQGKEIFDFWRNVTNLLEVTIGVGNLTTTEWNTLDSIIRNSMPSVHIGLEAFMNPIYINPKTAWPTDPNISGDANDNIFYPSAGNLNMSGLDGDDVILSGEGQYSGLGGTGNDTYVLSAGFGSSTAASYITEYASEGEDTIWLTGGLTVNNIRSWTDYLGRLYLQIDGGSEDTIQVAGSNSSSGTDIHQKIEKIVFDDGYSLNFADGLELVFPDGNIANAKGTALDDTFIGGVGNQSMSGYAGNDIFISGVGQSSFTGGSGNDVYKFSAGFGGTGSYYTSYVIEEAAEGTDRIVFTGSLTSNDVYTWVTSGTLYFRVGSDYHNTIGVLNGSYNASTGYVTNLEFVEFLGNSVVYDLTQGLTLNDTEDSHDIRGSAQNDTINGNNGNDTIYSYAGNDTLNGGTGNDYIAGGTGNDVYVLNPGSGLDSIIEATGEGTDTIRITGVNAADIRIWTNTNGSLLIQNKNLTSEYVTVAAGYSGGLYQSTIGQYVEQIVFDDNTTWNLTGGLTMEGDDSSNTLYGTVYNDTIYAYEWQDILYGNGGNDSLYGGTGNDSLYGGAGNDILDGGDGDDFLDGEADTDTVSYASATAAVTVNLTTTSAQNTGGAGNDTIYNIENLTGSSYNDTLTGNSGANVIEGGAGNDTLNGAGGTDTVSYLTATSGVNVSLAVTSAQVTGGAGTDTITNIENLTGSLYGDLLIGDSGNNTINGDAGDDVIEGGVGNDTLIGGSGTDRLSYASAVAGVTLNLATLTAQNTVGAGTDTVSGFENLAGSAYNDTLTGNGSANTIEGGAGNDTINGAGGTDTLTYGSATAGVTVNLATTTAQNTVGAGTDTISNFENLTGSAYNDTLTGNASANVIEGGSGDDTLNGSGGTDTLTYISATAGVTMNLATTTAQNTVGAGTDTVSNFENLTGSSYNDTLTGNSGANVIEGGAGNDTLNGAGGTDTLTYVSAGAAVIVSLALTTAQNTGGAGIDTISNFEKLTGSSYNDMLTGSTAANTILGGAGNDILYGGSGNDTLNGGDGNDVLYGEAGLDAMTGGLNADTFVFQAASAYSNIDTVSDFNTAQGDALNIANLLSEYDYLTEAITDFVQMVTSGSNTTVSVDRDGIGTTYGFTQIATLTGVTGLTDEGVLVANGNLIVT